MWSTSQNWRLWKSGDNEVLVEVHLTLGAVDLQTHPLVISPVPECLIRIDTLSNWEDPHFGSLTSGVKAECGGKGRVEATRIATT